MKIDEIEIVDYNDQYAEAISQIVIRNLLEVNINDYSKEKIDKLVLKFTPDKINEYAKERKVFAAVMGNTPVGTLGVAKSWDELEGSYIFLTIFVLPECQRKGIGRLLIKKGEDYVREIKGTKIAIPSSITSHIFYNKMGYQYRDNNKEPDSFGCIVMDKYL